MFRRRYPRTDWQNIREFFWPSIGWKRALSYNWHRLIRLSDPPERIAAGMATGVAVSFSPLVGTHFIQAFIVCRLLRANIVAAVLGTMFGNPWTFPFLWAGGAAFGLFLFDVLGLTAYPTGHIAYNLPGLWALIKADPAMLFWPWLVGGTICGVIIWPFAYMLSFRIVLAARKARMLARLHRMRKHRTEEGAGE